jgi:hypothetical protein
VSEFPDQARLADAGVAHDADDLSTVLARHRCTRLQHHDLVATADERPRTFSETSRLEQRAEHRPRTVGCAGGGTGAKAEPPAQEHTDLAARQHAARLAFRRERVHHVGRPASSIAVDPWHRPVGADQA